MRTNLRRAAAQFDVTSGDDVVFGWRLRSASTKAWGTDAATLYLFALLVPDTAARVHATFDDVLDSRDGRAAQVGVAARILRRAERGEFPDLADAVRRHIADLLS